MAGHAEPMRPEVPARAAEAFRRRPDGKVHFVRVLAERDDDGVLQVRSAGGQGSHHLTAMARAHALLPLADGDGVEAGAPVRVLLLADV
jgi:molybdopterin molybdotransferase